MASRLLVNNAIASPLIIWNTSINGAKSFLLIYQNNLIPVNYTLKGAKYKLCDSIF